MAYARLLLTAAHTLSKTLPRQSLPVKLGQSLLAASSRRSTAHDSKSSWQTYQHMHLTYLNEAASCRIDLNFELPHHFFEITLTQKTIAPNIKKTLMDIGFEGSTSNLDTLTYQFRARNVVTYYPERNASYFFALLGKMKQLGYDINYHFVFSRFVNVCLAQKIEAAVANYRNNPVYSVECVTYKKAQTEAKLKEQFLNTYWSCERYFHMPDDGLVNALLFKRKAELELAAKEITDASETASAPLV